MKRSFILLLALSLGSLHAQEAAAPSPVAAAPAALPTGTAGAPPTLPAQPPQAEPAPSPTTAKLSFPAPKSTIVGPWSGTQLIVTDEATGVPRDVTYEAALKPETPGIVAIDEKGYVTPLKNGRTRLLASLSGTSAPPAVIEIEVTGFDTPAPIHFSQEVVSVFTKYGCNSGGCHGK